MIVAFAHRGRSRAPAPPRQARRAGDGRDERSRLRGGACAARIRLARPRRRASARHAGVPPARATRDRAVRTRARELLRPAHGRLRRARRPRCRPAARFRDERGRRSHARLPAARLPRRGPRLRPARADRQGLALHRRRLARAHALEARGQGLGQSEDARAPAPARDGWRAARALRAAANSTRGCLRHGPGMARAARGRVPLPRDRGPGARDRSGEGRPRSAASDGPARLRRRRLRQDRGRAPRSVRGRRRRQAGADARPDDRARPAALEHVPRPLPRFSRTRRDGLALSQAGRRSSACLPTTPKERSKS